MPPRRGEDGLTHVVFAGFLARAGSGEAPSAETANRHVISRDSGRPQEKLGAGRRGKSKRHCPSCVL
eukprot:3081323-Rhodomonas_salina.1